MIFFSTTVRSAATVYALMVTLLIGLLCSGLILFAVYNREEMARMEDKVVVAERCSSAMELLLHASTDSLTNQKLEELSDEECTVSGGIKNWGVYTLIYSSAKGKKSNSENSALAGSPSHAYGDGSLYLSNSRQALYLGGLALLKGAITIPQAGLKRDFSNSGYQRETLYDGIPRISADNLPNGYQVIAERGYALVAGRFNEGDSVVVYEEAREPSLDRSFIKSTIRLTSKDTIQLENGSLSNNIVVYSPASIKVGARMKLDNVILVSPLIVIDQGFTGNCQLISSNVIRIGADVKLKYPSAILHLDDGDSLQLGSGVVIDSSASVQGSILMLNWKFASNKSVLILKKGSEFNGLLVCETRLDLRGNVQGVVHTRKFVSIGQSSYRENYLVDGVIEPWEKFDRFAGPLIDNRNSTKTWVKWLQN